MHSGQLFDSVPDSSLLKKQTFAVGIDAHHRKSERILLALGIITTPAQKQRNQILQAFEKGDHSFPSEPETKEEKKREMPAAVCDASPLDLLRTKSEEDYSICIQEYTSPGGCIRPVGKIVEVSIGHLTHPENWLPCDKDGWISHVPTENSSNPVPKGLSFAVLLRNGRIDEDTKDNRENDIWWQMGVPGKREPANNDILFWRPLKAQS